MPLQSATGDLDPMDVKAMGDQSARIHATVEQPDGKFIIAGDFTAILGEPRYYIARLHADSTLDATFDPHPNGVVNCVALQDDGKILIGGEFTSIQPNGAAASTARSRLARMNTDGTLDDSFAAGASSSIHSLTLQPDGGIILAGSFSAVRGNGKADAARSGVARLYPGGALDEEFNPGADSAVYCTALQADGKLLLGGDFTSLRPAGAAGPIGRVRMARLHTDGTLDEGFNATANAAVLSMVLQADGKVVLGGNFTAINPGTGSTSSDDYVSRLNPDGTKDTSFVPYTNGGMDSLALQADGKLVLGGRFTAFNVGYQRRGHARMNVNGSLDTGYGASTDGSVQSVALQADGRVLLGGGFTTIQPTGAPLPVSRHGFARLYNDTASQVLSAPDTSQVLWARSGSGPELTAVTFALSTDNGANWISLGRGTRTGASANWHITGLALPVRAILRVRGRTTGGRYNGSSGLIEQTLTIGGDPGPEITVRGNNVNIATGDTNPVPGDFTDLARSSPGAPAIRRWFQIVNEGNADLMPGSVTVSGEHAADFTITAQPPASIPGGGSAGFEVSFVPATLGLRRATLSFLTNDSDESPFHFAIHGIGAEPKTAVSGNRMDIPDGDLSPSLADHTDFGSTNSRGGTAVRTFSIQNIGEGSLAPGPVAVEGANGEFTVIAQPAAFVMEGSLTTFVVQFAPATAGPATAVLRFNTNDSDKTPFTFTVRGTGTEPGAGDPGLPDAVISGTSVVTRAVYATAVQPDGKVIIAGDFTSVMGVPRNYLARLNADGSLDQQFDPRPTDRVHCVAIQPDRRILIGGYFSSLQPNGAAAAAVRRFIARINPDGTLDEGFDPRANAPVRCIAIQDDGKILLGGQFTSLQPNGAPSAVSRQYIARVHANGSLDDAFDPRAGFPLRCIAVQPDGRIVLGGSFTTLSAANVQRNFIGRINANGTLDTGFNPSADNSVYCVAVQPDGKVLLGGDFTSLRPNGTGTAVTRNRVARVNANGTVDTEFNPAANGLVRTLALQTDGKVIMAGDFTALQPNGAAAQTPQGRVARLYPDGALDAGFNPGANFDVHSVALEPGGQVLLGGAFTSLMPQGAVTPTPRAHFARLHNDVAMNTLSVIPPSEVLWTRSGAGPELTAVTFELSTDNGANWTLLGAGTRAGFTPDWRRTEIALPAAGLIRARGRTAGGQFNGSSGLIEKVTAFPLSPFDQWRRINLGDADSDALGDPNGNGIVNLIEYALGGDPRGSAPGRRILPRTGSSADDRLQLSFDRHVDRTDLILTVQAADVLTGPWMPLARSIGGGTFEILAPGAGVVETGTGETRSVIVTDLVRQSDPAHPHRFMRLEVSR